MGLMDAAKKFLGVALINTSDLNRQATNTTSRDTPIARTLLGPFSS